jgi:YgiT-type zinc finger domain-containing protein
MICLICREAGVQDGVTSIAFERGEMSFVVRNVPARVCSHCGEAYVDEIVAVRLLRGAEMLAHGEIYESSIEYDSLAWDHPFA